MIYSSCINLFFFCLFMCLFMDLQCFAMREIVWKTKKKTHQIKWNPLSYGTLVRLPPKSHFSSVRSCASQTQTSVPWLPLYSTVHTVHTRGSRMTRHDRCSLLRQVQFTDCRTSERASVVELHTAVTSSEGSSTRRHTLFVCCAAVLLILKWSISVNTCRTASF